MAYQCFVLSASRLLSSGENPLSDVGAGAWPRDFPRICITNIRRDKESASLPRRNS